MHEIVPYSHDGFVTQLPQAKTIIKPKYLNIELLRLRCAASIESFAEYGSVTKTNDGIFVFQNNDSSVLAVAHLDTVRTVENSKIFRVDGDKVYAPQLDDRLGVHLLLDILPNYMKYDLLLTEGEEQGRSTSKFFKSEKKYNWMFEIDRAGLQTVMYQFETAEYRKLLISYGLEIGIGSFTDICWLDDLGVFGFNLACAYYANHTLSSYVDTVQLDSQIEKLLRFYEDNKDTLLSHDKTARGRYGNLYENDYNRSYTYYPAGGRLDQNSKSSKLEPGFSSNKYRSYDPDYEIVRCSSCGAEGFAADFFCDYCGSDLSDSYKSNVHLDSCTICNSPDCTGISKCPACGFDYHDDIYINTFHICRDCIEGIFSVSSDILDSFQAKVIIGDDTESLVMEILTVIGEL